MGGDGWTKLSEVVVGEEMVEPNFQRLWCGRRWLNQTFRGCGREEMVGPNFQRLW